MPNNRPDPVPESDIVRGPFWTEIKREPSVSEVTWDADVMVLYVVPEEQESQEAVGLLRQEGFDFHVAVAPSWYREEFKLPRLFSPIGCFEGLEHIRGFPHDADLMRYQMGRHEKNSS